MSSKPFIQPLPPMQRIDLYARMFSDAYAMLLNLHTNAHVDPCPLRVNKDIDESVPLSSSDGQVVDNTERDIGLSTNLNYKGLDASFEIVREESVYDHDSTESSNPSLNHKTQETSLVSGPYLYYWGPEHWLMHPSLYDKYMNRYLDMPFEFEVDYATSLPSLGPSYGVVDDVTLDLAKIAEQIEYYFSFDNLINDVIFREHMAGEGWVPLPFVVSLPEVRKLTSNVKVILEALRTSFAIEMDGGKYIRHRHTWQRAMDFTQSHMER